MDEVVTAPAPLLLHRLLLGEPAGSVGDWLRQGVRTWLLAGGALPLERCLLLPSPRRVAIMTRDYWLAAAGDMLGNRAAALYRAACDFEARAWPAWRHLSAPPRYASKLEGALFYARQAAPFPGTRRQYANIIGGKRSAPNASRNMDRARQPPQTSRRKGGFIHESRSTDV